MSGDGDGGGYGGDGDGKSESDGDGSDDGSWVPGSFVARFAQIIHTRLYCAMQVAQNFLQKLECPGIVVECSEVMADTSMVSSDNGQGRVERQRARVK